MQTAGAITSLEWANTRSMALVGSCARCFSGLQGQVAALSLPGPEPVLHMPSGCRLVLAGGGLCPELAAALPEACKPADSSELCHMCREYTAVSRWLMAGQDVSNGTVDQSA